MQILFVKIHPRKYIRTNNQTTVKHLEDQIHKLKEGRTNKESNNNPNPVIANSIYIYIYIYIYVCV